jgi:hypothetical protein
MTDAIHTLNAINHNQKQQAKAASKINKQIKINA